MSTEPETTTVTLDGGDTVSAVVYYATAKRIGVTVILGHGAGANQHSSFMKLFAGGLAARGCDAMTFNFLYMERGRGAPDQKAKLESCYRSVIKAAAEYPKLKRNRMVIGGKSMGGRIASLVAAQVAATEMDNISALVFLGYPLHPPGKPEKLRVEHLPGIRAPMLFLQGTKDAFGTPDEIQRFIRELKLPARIYVIEGGDHSFKVLKSSPVPQAQVYELAIDEIVRWLTSAD
jgi:predicted alpha/beta-hydrolase family hydrolase